MTFKLTTSSNLICAWTIILHVEMLYAVPSASGATSQEKGDLLVLHLHLRRAQRLGQKRQVLTEIEACARAIDGHDGHDGRGCGVVTR